MRIEKVINNNVVCSRNADDGEIVLMGRGIGFKAREGDLIPQERIEKIFRIEDPKTVDRFKELLADMPLEHVQISNDVISYAKKILNTKLNQSIYVTLTDHINFAIERYRQGIPLSNAIIWEIQRFYHQEFLIGEYAVELINQRLGLCFKKDEAGFIALHFVNAEYDTNLKDTIHITRLIQDVLARVKEDFHVEFDESSLHYERFVTHIKFLAQRIFRGELLTDDNQEFQDMMLARYPAESLCSQKIADMIEEEYGIRIPAEEILYLTVHIRRVTISIINNEEEE